MYREITLALWKAALPTNHRYAPYVEWHYSDNFYFAVPAQLRKPGSRPDRSRSSTNHRRGAPAVVWRCHIIFIIIIFPFKSTNSMHSGALRPALRSVAARSVSRRTYVNAGEGALGESFLKEREAIRKHASGSSELWRKITYYVGFPSIVLALINAYNLAQEHERHLEHIKEENGGELPERIHYDYLNIRNKPFPWGNKTLFYNPKVNLPVD
ncbi:hypothetical protein O181_057177 [Austropuccinia psidii MF-1]|uniref:Cytochrome c oxidase subunit 13, mitochondrial n=1 Tax=Austropuccinia psidii MF-1 TaxID=1389203 RepID=A0A9Q3EC85_9BASI|nr:hypothetical protein [Austropuccinia psidii MF-1]